MDQSFFSDKTVLIMGLGRFGGGVDAAKFAWKAGARVIVTDLASDDDLHDSVCQLDEYNDIQFVFGLHDFSYFQQADIVIVNPAVPDDNKFVEFAREQNKLVTSQINLFFELCDATIVGVTGSNGKSTTTSLIFHLLETAARDDRRKYDKVWLGGNIGNQPLLSRIEEIGANDIVVLELSSFQLERLGEIKKAPHVAVLTNLTPNHLDRHGTFGEYCEAKGNIFKFQIPNEDRPAVAVFCGEDDIASQWFEKYNAQAGRLCFKVGPEDVSEDIKSRYPLPGRGNLCNLAQAVTVARYFGVDDETVMQTIADFKALPHRLEFVCQTKGVKWYNDSISTTPQSSIEALNAFKEPKIIIAGGYDKHIDLDELGLAIAQKAKAVILIGQCREKIAEAVSKNSNAGTSVAVKRAETLAQAVETADQMASPGDVVLLSPACASYDMFDNYQHRGNEFARLAIELTS